MLHSMGAFYTRELLYLQPEIEVKKEQVIFNFSGNTLSFLVKLIVINKS